MRTMSLQRDSMGILGEEEQIWPQLLHMISVNTVWPKVQQSICVVRMSRGCMMHFHMPFSYLKL